MSKGIDEVNIRILVDARVDSGNYRLMAERGFAALIDVYYDDMSSTRLLFDTGSSTPALVHNLKEMNLDISTVDMVILSHGHWDHVGGLMTMLKLIGKKVPVLLHPNAIAPKIYTPDEGEERDVGIENYFTVEELENAAEIITTTEPYEIGEGIWTTGEVPRTNDFEKLTGTLTKIHTFRDGVKVLDSLVDDLSLIFKLKDESVVLFTGCCHAGLVNTMNHATTITGTSNFIAVVGGLHLYDASKERLAMTVEYLKGHTLTTLSPCHCTGLRGQAALMYAFEGVFKEVGSGSLLKFKSK
ncbi:MBL fold metallo-hydrolase [Candidatus Thorarchaeota archaeon]|nr:MAG: MBL fold metallo-hydrolase [Candidatus Thorarchaeota archaeon]